MSHDSDAALPTSNTPVASVILPARDGGDALDEQLTALAGQSLASPWEVVVVDDGSVDDTPARARAWADRLPDLTVIEQGEPRGSGQARNDGAAAARADLLLFCDADDVVGHGWLAAHVEALEQHGFVTGPIVTSLINDQAVVAGGPPDDWETAPPVGNRFLPYALGANLGIRREVFDRVGGFDGSRRHGNDKVLSWTVQLTGTPLHFASGALVHYRLRPTTRGTFARQRSIGRSAPGLYRRFRAHGMPRSSVLGAARDWLRLIVGLTSLASPEARIELARTAGRRLGRLEGSFRERTLYL